MHCRFCTDLNEQIIAEAPLAVAFYDRYPVNPGHALVVPKRHFADFFTATEEEIVDIFRLLQEVKDILNQKYHPDGYNVGVNAGQVAGQSVMHLHVHIIPRYQGDDEMHKGGIRNLMPRHASPHELA